MRSDYDLVANVLRPDCSLYLEDPKPFGAEVYLNFGGDGLYLFETSSNRENTFAEQIVNTFNRVATLYDAIKHGDKAHRLWLKRAIEAHFQGQEMPEP